MSFVVVAQYLSSAREALSRAIAHLSADEPRTGAGMASLAGCAEAMLRVLEDHTNALESMQAEIGALTALASRQELAIASLRRRVERLETMGHIR